MKFFDWKIFGWNWKRIYQSPSVGQSQTPRFEIRTYEVENLTETWFFILNSANCIEKQRISTKLIPQLINQWRSFLHKCESYDVGIMPKHWWMGSYRIIINEELRWTDSLGRDFEYLQLIQEANYSSNNGLKIRIGENRMDFQTFREWLDLLDEHHKPYSATMNIQPE